MSTFIRAPLLALFLCLAWGAEAAGQAPSEGPQPLQIVPPPRDRPPVIVGHIGVHAVIPLLRGSLCPPGAACVFGGGGGVGLGMELRWPIGLAVGGSYSAWFLNGHGVFRPSILQTLQVHFRYAMPTQILLHPYLRIGFGALLLGDQSSLASTGIAVDAALGSEIELGETLALDVAVGARLFSTNTFTTPSDSVTRGEGTKFSGVVYLEAGLAIFGTR